MKTSYTTLLILAAALISQSAFAKLGAKHPNMQTKSSIELNIEAQINDHIDIMMAKVVAPKIKTEVAKQLHAHSVQIHTDGLVQDAGEKLPGFKFKVVFAD